MALPERLESDLYAGDLLDTRTFNEPVLACPVCGFHCTHLRDVTESTSTFYHERVITIGAYCEQGHEFTVTLTSHKGSVFVTTEHTGTVSSDDEPAEPQDEHLA